MLNLKARSYRKELLDADHIPFDDIKQNMRELNTVNTLLGGHKITIDGIKAVRTAQPSDRGSTPFTICEIGCGGGDNLHAIEKWCKKNNINASFIGIDIKKECIDFARQQYPSLNAEWIVNDYQKVVFGNVKPAIIFSSLFCHHFSEPSLAKMLNWMKDNSSKGFFVNDLQRHPLAYYSIKLLTRIFSKSYLVKNDAPLSVARGFKRNEWVDIFSKAGIHQYNVEWKWAFRYLIVFRHEQ